jgi:hypothetical protein
MSPTTENLFPPYTTYEDGTDIVFRHGGAKFRSQGITQKEEYSFQNRAKI